MSHWRRPEHRDKSNLHLTRFIMRCTSGASRMTRAKARSVGFVWKSATPNPAVPSSVHQYLDKCVDWLLHPPHEPEADVKVHATLWPFDKGDIGTNVALSRRDVVTTRSRSCMICGEPTQRHMVGNPFAHRHLVMVCTACFPA